MSRVRDYCQHVSLKLSEVLGDIGVTERMVLKRRRAAMLRESMQTIAYRLEGENVSVYCFGSQSEGTTSQGLRSDVDLLICNMNVNVIQDWSNWRPGMFNLLIVQDETTSPGYCLLQELRHDVPLPLTRPRPRIHVTDRRGKVLLRSAFYNGNGNDEFLVHGPAHTPRRPPGFIESDHVPAYHCESWPKEARHWLERQGIGGWPSVELKRYSFNTGCYVVPVSSKSGQNKETEWRVSTSQAERYLMYSMNITQIRCYILMKMILKTFINPQCDGVISSYMCKTVLFHCIQNTHSQQWQENHLLPCLTRCLLVLQHFIRDKNCPHFIIPANNLMAERISFPVKQQLLEILQHVIQSEGRVLLQIPFDCLGWRLQEKMNIMPFAIHQALQNLFPDLMSSSISKDLVLLSARTLSDTYNEHLRQIMCCNNAMTRLRLSKYIFSLARVYLIPDVTCTFMLKTSICELLFPFLCSSLGSVIASSDIHLNNTISQQALAWLSAGLNSDASSGRLKLASALYCAGNMESTELILKDTEERYDVNFVVPVCECYQYIFWYVRPGFLIKSNTGNEELIKQITAFCVTFMRCEKDCVPKELQYEMFRSTEDELLHRDRRAYMDWAVVDSLPYLSFLQYKTYGHLQRAADQQRALTYLATIIDTEPVLKHRETALNLLGQCMEQESRHNDALRCYSRSLKIRPRNNAAKIHICRLLNSLVNRQSS